MILSSGGERRGTGAETGARIKSASVEEEIVAEIEAMSEMTETDGSDTDHTQDPVQDHDRPAATKKDISAHAGIGLGVRMASGTDTEDTDTVMTVDHGLQREGTGTGTDVIVAQGLQNGGTNTGGVAEVRLRWILIAENNSKTLPMEPPQDLESFGALVAQIHRMQL